jgi:hypothetical protein
LLLLIEQRNQDNLQPGFDGQATWGNWRFQCCYFILWMEIAT